MRAAHGRARAAKNPLVYIYLSMVLCLSYSFHIHVVLDGDGEIGKGQIEEGGCEETFLYLNQAKEKCRFTVPPVVAL